VFYLIRCDLSTWDDEDRGRELVGRKFRVMSNTNQNLGTPVERNFASGELKRCQSSDQRPQSDMC
jgi:hypothetical protein